MDQRLLFGLGVSVMFGFARWLFPAVPKWFAAAGLTCGVGLMLWSVMPFIRPGPAILALVSLAGLAAAATWQLQSRASQPEARSSGNGPKATPVITPRTSLAEDAGSALGLDPNTLKGSAMPKDDPNAVIGADINHIGGGVGMEIQSHGTVGKPSTGAEIVAVGKPGQSVTGMRVTQSGPGTGLKIVQSGPGTGLKIVVGTAPDNTAEK